MFASCVSGRLPYILYKERLGAYPGVGAFHSSGKISHLGAYPGVGACPGDYGITNHISRVGKGARAPPPLLLHPLNKPCPTSLYSVVYSERSTHKVK